MQVVHRDIKPENVLMTSWRVGARIILTDFGQSRTIKDVEEAAESAGVFRMQSVVGTYGYTAPEVYQQMQQDLQSGSGYSKAIDIWSIGCVTATLMTNEFVFPDGRDLQFADASWSDFQQHLEILDKGAEWQHIGHRVKSFVRGCLATNEKDRLTATQCLAMPWFQHPYYRAEFDAAYKRAVADWTPKEYDSNIIEIIDTSDILLEATRSRHFAPHQQEEDSLDAGSECSETFDPAASPVEVPETPPFHQDALLSSSCPAPPQSLLSLPQEPKASQTSDMMRDSAQGKSASKYGTHPAASDTTAASNHGCVPRDRGHCPTSPTFVAVNEAALLLPG